MLLSQYENCYAMCHARACMRRESPVAPAYLEVCVETHALGSLNVIERGRTLGLSFASV